MNLLGSHPERLKNLHFSFVVMLRALKKATPVLYHYDFSTGDLTLILTLTLSPKP